MMSDPGNGNPRRDGRRWAFAAVLLVSAVIAALPALAQPPPPAAVPLEQVLARCFEAYGGVPALERLRAVRQQGRIASAMRGHGTVERSFEFPGRLRVESAFPGGLAEVRVLADDAGWRNGAPVAGQGYQAMVLQAARLALPRLLLVGRERLVDRGPVDRDDGRFRLLELPLREDMGLEVEIEEDGGLIRRSRGRAGALVFETRYDDFRRVGGLLFAFREQTWIMGQPSGSTELTEVTLHDDLPPELFQP